ncbi:uncharacterized protein MICPUCDRAFT_51974 [Micromonas pusilla CCMP1545]|uniref:Predicted protein n=1 Tax=Micromonas pusilla (strain CCMP1545) TaxID=564608 RepID=C1N2Z3_MICPC|nr:uncharacterized protein MICPUCDRAFT_51974 [Micromonas pusilla CCMP1545]EEH53108.1 predicted protein [Micromonas pusilla CCMP1545]|eukprot:XP_003062289.1 predicted protein [Micromonas pusilla CCMP1545]
MSSFTEKFTESSLGEAGKTYPCDADGWCNRDWVALVLLGVALIFCVAGKRLHRLNVFILAAAIGSFAGLWIADTFNVDDFNTRWGICIGLAVAISLMVYMIESLVFSLLGVATCAGGAMVIYSALAEHLPSSTPAYTFHLVIGVAAAVGFLLGGVLKKAALTVIYRRVDRFPRDPARAAVGGFLVASVSSYFLWKKDEGEGDLWVEHLTSSAKTIDLGEWQVWLSLSLGGIACLAGIAIQGHLCGGHKGEHGSADEKTPLRRK